MKLLIKYLQQAEVGLKKNTKQNMEISVIGIENNIFKQLKTSAKRL